MAFNVDAVAVPYVAWHIMSLPISSSAQDGDSSMHWRQWEQEANRPGLGPGSASIF